MDALWVSTCIKVVIESSKSSANAIKARAKTNTKPGGLCRVFDITVPMISLS
jgi:hypothetical protein